jgi:hypothetical protein
MLTSAGLHFHIRTQYINHRHLRFFDVLQTADCANGLKDGLETGGKIQRL